jgi:2-isopropylmalate synthase
MHVHAVQKLARSYEHVLPESVGNTRRILISELAGASNVLAKTKDPRLLSDKKFARKVVNEVARLENEGYEFEAAEASFDLLIRRMMDKYRSFFKLDHYRSVILKQDARKPVAEATVKLSVDGKEEHHVAEGHGPVDALAVAISKCLEPHYPSLESLRLVDYKVRVVNARAGTAARVRVVIEFRDGHELFSTVGVSENIIDASWEALVSGIEYKLLRESDSK